MEKTFFGGYKKASTDFIIKQLTEDDERAQEKIAILENNLRISNENIELMRSELERKTKDVLVLTRELENKNEQIEELNEKYQKAAGIVKSYNDQIKKLDQLYDGIESYTKKKKSDLKAKSLAMTDSIFEEYLSAQEKFESSFSKINQQKDSLKQQLSILSEAFLALQSHVDNIEVGQDNISFDFENLKSLKDQIKAQIEEEYTEESDQENLPPKWDFIQKPWEIKEEYSEENNLELIKKKIDSFKQIERNVSKLPKKERVSLPDAVSYKPEEPSVIKEASTEQQQKKNSINGSERESYKRYFADITEKYSKEQHSLRVALLCKKMGEALELPENKIEELKTVGLLHDIGKIAIDKKILNKRGRLTDEEWNEIKQHPEIGYRVLSMVDGMSNIAEYVLYHHESWDGQGYPAGLRGENIPLASRIIMIADAYDAMTSERNYKRTLSDEDAKKELQKNAGIQFDPNLVDIFVEKVLKENA